MDGVVIMKYKLKEIVLQISEQVNIYFFSI